MVELTLTSKVHECDAESVRIAEEYMDGSQCDCEIIECVGPSAKDGELQEDDTKEGEANGPNSSLDHRNSDSSHSGNDACSHQDSSSGLR